MFKFRILIILFLLQIYNVKADEKCDREPNEKPPHLKLRDDLLCGYDKTVRPVKDSRTTIVVDTVQILRHIRALEYSQSISADGWFAMRWKDEHMTWNPADYENIRYIILNAGDLWTPDISSYGSTGLTQTEAILDADSRCIVGNNSYVMCVTTTSIRSECAIRLKHFPYDVHNCTIQLGSWVHTGEEISYNNTLIDVHDEYFASLDWQLEKMSASQQIIKLQCCPNTTFPSIIYNFIMRRKASSYIISYLLPFIAMMTITLLAMWLDPDAPDRIYITALNVPCHVLFLQYLSWDIPHQGDEVPYLVQLLRDSLIMVSFTLVETVLVRGFLTTKRESPYWLASSLSVVVGTKVGQFLLFSEVNPQTAVGNITADDSSNLMEAGAERPKEWYLLGRIIDRLCFVIFVFIYLITFLLFMTK